MTDTNPPAPDSDPLKDRFEFLQKLFLDIRKDNEQAQKACAEGQDKINARLDSIEKKVDAQAEVSAALAKSLERDRKSTRLNSSH